MIYPGPVPTRGRLALWLAGAAEGRRVRSAVAMLMAAVTAMTVAMLSAASPAKADTVSFYKIAYGDYGSSYLVNPDGTGNELFRNVSFGEFDWTPDGEKFVFRNDSGGGLYIRNQDGATFPVGVSGQSPALSPDGTKIAYARGQATEEYGEPGFHNTVIDVVDLSGNFLATLGPGRQPTWSPDGTKIAFAKRGQRIVGCEDPRPTPDTVEMRSYGLAVGPATGGSVAWLLEPNKPLGGTGGDGDVYWRVGSAPDWSPDGTEIAVYGDRLQVNYDPNFGVYGGCGSEQVGGPTNNDIFKVPAGGGNPENLTAAASWVGASGSGEPTDMHPSFSPDGSQIAFSSERNVPRDGGIHSLWKMNANGSDQQLVVATQRVDSTDWMTALPAGYAVRINAPDATATEEGRTPGTFTIQRTGYTDGDLEVTIKLSESSTATSGSDFAPLPTKVTIPDGTDLANLVVFPIDDDIVEPDENITVEIVSAHGVLVGEPSKATITIADNDGQSGGPGETCRKATATLALRKAAARKTAKRAKKLKKNLKQAGKRLAKANRKAKKARKRGENAKKARQRVNRARKSVKNTRKQAKKASNLTKKAKTQVKQAGRRAKSSCA